MPWHRIKLLNYWLPRKKTTLSGENVVNHLSALATSGISFDSEIFFFLFERKTNLYSESYQTGQHCEQKLIAMLLFNSNFIVFFRCFRCEKQFFISNKKKLEKNDGNNFFNKFSHLWRNILKSWFYLLKRKTKVLNQNEGC